MENQKRKAFVEQRAKAQFRNIKDALCVKMCDKKKDCQKCSWGNLDFEHRDRVTLRDYMVISR